MGDEEQHPTQDEQRPVPAVPPSATDPPVDDPRAADEQADDDHVLPDEVPYSQRGSALPPRVERWRRRSATGAMMTGFAMGLREVLETEQREPAIVLETSGVPPRDLAVEADLDNLPPRQSVVKVRRWLLHDPALTGADGERPDPAGDGEKPPVAPTAIRKRAPRPSRASRLFGGKGS